MVKFRLTFPDVPALTGDYGNTKDKTADLKYHFWAEGKWMPALALGFLAYSADSASMMRTAFLVKNGVL